jgi:integrase
LELRWEGMAELTSKPSPEVFGTKVGSKSCKLPSKEDTGISPLCPQCRSKKVWRDGRRYFFDQRIQRWICRDCGLRFSDQNDLQKAKKAIETIETVETQSLKTPDGIVATTQICVTETKNLAAEQQIEVLPRNETGEFKQKILEYAIWLKSNGRSEATIFGRVKLLRRLAKRGANLYDPESLKKTIAEQKWCNGQKSNAVDAYSSFLKMLGGEWEPPAYKSVRKIPFIPKEAEIDQLIAGSSIRMATFLTLLKETGARCGEIWQLNWTDVDFESKVVNITPEKNSNPRVARLSNKLLEMLDHLPKNYGDRVFSFPHMRIDNYAVNFQRQRRRTANKIQNQRLLKIHFHTFRYWKGTILYHQTKDMYYVMQRLGHKNIKNTLLYVQLEEALFQGENEYISKVAKTAQEICALIEAGFEYVTDFQDSKIFKKRK